MPKRVSGIKSNFEVWLGDVINREKNIFYNHKDGFFQFTVSNWVNELSDKELKQLKDQKNVAKPKKITTCRSYSVEFGDIYIFNKYLSDSGIFEILTNIVEEEKTDTFKSLILHKFLSKNAYSYAFDWWNETFTKYLYPNAKLESQRISEFVALIGTETCRRTFFTNYLDYLKNLNPKFFTLIDSTGLQNSINISLTAINNHNGVINNEIRLITVLDKISELPVYYRYVPGNIVDVSTLTMIINELRAYNIDIAQAILDAGYFSEDNLKLLYNFDIPFLTRMVPRKGFYESLIKMYAPNILDQSNYVKHGGRTLFIKKIKETLFDIKMPVNIFICHDREKYNSDSAKYFEKYDENIAKEEYELDKLKFGIFILVSTVDLEANNVLSTYYNRQSIEQLFDYIKNDINILPLRMHSEETFSGHLLLSFIATICFITINKIVKVKNISVNRSIDRLRRYNCRIFNNRMIPDVAPKAVNEIAKALKIKIPKAINIENNSIRSFEY
jgi:hypothetical protein